MSGGGGNERETRRVGWDPNSGIVAQDGMMSALSEGKTGIPPYESYPSWKLRREREAKARAREQATERAVGRYGEEIGHAYIELVDPSLDARETDTGRDIDRSLVLAMAINATLETNDPQERLKALTLFTDEIQRIHEHRHREPRF